MMTVRGHTFSFDEYRQWAFPGPRSRSPTPTPHLHPRCCSPVGLVSVYIPWRLWVETRLALPLEYPRLEYPSAAHKGGSRHHPIDNLRRRSGCMKHAARFISWMRCSKIRFSCEQSSVKLPPIARTRLVTHVASPHLANIFFLVRSVSLTPGLGFA